MPVCDEDTPCWAISNLSKQHFCTEPPSEPISPATGSRDLRSLRFRVQGLELRVFWSFMALTRPHRTPGCIMMRISRIPKPSCTPRRENERPEFDGVIPTNVCKSKLTINHTQPPSNFRNFQPLDPQAPTLVQTRPQAQESHRGPPSSSNPKKQLQKDGSKIRIYALVLLLLNLRPATPRKHKQIEHSSWTSPTQTMSPSMKATMFLTFGLGHPLTVNTKSLGRMLGSLRRLWQHRVENKHQWKPPAPAEPLSDAHESFRRRLPLQGAPHSLARQAMTMLTS